MKKRFLTGRGLLAAAVLAAGGGVLAFWAAPAQAAPTPPQITKVIGSTGAATVTLGHPKPAATAHLSPSYIAYAPNGDEAVSAVTSTGQAHVYLIAGATEPNEYHIETAAGTPPVFGTLVKGDAYLVAGNGTAGQIADPGAPTTITGGSTSVFATSNPVAPNSLAFDNAGNLLINGHHGNTASYTSGIQLVAKAVCSSSCPYSESSLTAGGLYTIAGEGMRGITRTPAIQFVFGVPGFGVSVDSSGNILDSSNGAVLFLNEQATSVGRYGKTLASHSATIVAGTATTGSATCGSGSKKVPATGSSSPNLAAWQPTFDSAGDVYLNDDRSTAHQGCTWVLPAASGSLDGQTVTAGDVTSLTGAATTTAVASNGVANTSGFKNTSAVAVDPAGNLVVSLTGPTPAIWVIAESNGTQYDQSMTKGHAYLISGGASASRTTTPGNATGFEFAGAAIPATPPFPGITSLVNGAKGDVLLTNGTTDTNATAYEITGGPTTPVGPKATTTHLAVSPTGSAFVGTTVTLTATLTPSDAVGTVTFYNGLSPLATKPVVSGVATLHTTSLTAGPYSFTAKFVPTTATAFVTSTSSPAVTYTVKATTTRVTPVIQQFTLTVKPGQLTLSCTHPVTVEATAIKVCHLINLPSVTLNGRTQTRSAKMNTVYVNTARGTATSGWSLSAVMIPTLATLNTNPSCGSVQGFCDSSDGTHAATPHGQIPATDFKLNGFSCTPAATNHNPTPAPSAGGTLKTSLGLCSAAAGTSGGVFDIETGTYTLTVPSTNYHGLYYGTVEYTLVSVA